MYIKPDISMYPATAVVHVYFFQMCYVLFGVIAP